MRASMDWLSSGRPGDVDCWGSCWRCADLRPAIEHVRGLLVGGDLTMCGSIREFEEALKPEFRSS
jgi:hypothetical protein